MKIVATFDPSAKSSDTFNAGFPNGTGKMVVYNESNINLTISWDAFTTYCPAWTAMLYCVTTNNVNINWEQQSTLASAGAPISQVIVEIFNPDEPVLGTFPAPLVRQTNIGNTVSTSVGSIATLVNDGNTQQSVIESTPSGAGSSTVSVDNYGNVTIKGNNAGVLTTLLQLVAGASPAVKIAAAAIIAEVLGGLKVDGTLESVGKATFDNDIVVSGSVKSNTIRDNVNGNAALDLSAGTGAVAFPQDATFSGLGTGVSIAHNLGVTGSSSLDNALITTDGGGKLTAKGIVAGISNLVAQNNLTVSGSTSLDGGSITTDGAGAFSITSTGHTASGGASGSATLYQALFGTVKLVVVVLSAWHKTSAGDASISIPTPFTSQVVGVSFGSGPFHLNLSGVNQSVNVMTGFPASVGNVGTVSTGTAGANNNNIFSVSAIDAVALYGSQAGSFTGLIVLVGV